jgi:plasmid stability protein
MRQLVVRQIEDKVVRKLKERAGIHGVSMEEEHRRILLHDEAQAAWFHGLLERLFGRDA